MASFKRRQSSDYNQSVPETQNVPETHAYQEKHFQPTLNQPVSEVHSETEYGSTVTPDRIETRDDKSPRSTYTESSDQPGEDDLLNQQIEQNLQGNSDAGTQYSTPDVSSGVSSGPGGFTTYDPGTVAAATSTTAASTVVATSTVTAASISSVAIATAGAVIVAATLVLPLIIGVPSAIIFEDISVTDTTVYYSIYFEDYEEDMDLTVCLHNNFTNRTHAVESESISVMEEGLKPGVEYKITVYGSMSTVLDEITVTTEKNYEPEPVKPQLDVKSFDYRPQEGKIYLDSELSGDTSGLSSFKAVVYTSIDGVRTVLCSSDLTTLDGEQSVPLTIEKDKKYSATFAIEATDQEGAIEGLYSNDFTVFGTPFYSAPTFNLNNDTLQVICGYYDPYSARSDYTLVTKVMNSQSTEPVITYTPLNSGVTTIENISGGYSVYEMMAYIEYTESGSVVYPPDSTFDYNSLDSLVTVGGVGRAVVVPQSGVNGNLTITVGGCSETLSAVISVLSPDSGTYVDKTATLMNNTPNKTYTFDIMSTDNANVELQFYVETGGNNPMRGAYGTVVFAYASYTGTTATSNLNPSLNGPGIELTGFSVNDPYNIWSDYRATVTQSGATMITLCSDAPIVDNKVYFTNTNFENGPATLTVTCTQDGATVTVIDSATLSTNVYSGPTVSTGYYLDEVGMDLYQLSISLYSEFGEYGSSTEPKALYAFLFSDTTGLSISSGEFAYDASTITFDDLNDTDFPRGEGMRMQIRDGDGNLIASLEDAAMKQA